MVAVEILKRIISQRNYKGRMYRNKSSVSLRTLAYSLKQSINMDRNKAHSRQFIPLKSSASTVNLINHKNKTKKNNLTEDYLIMLDARETKYNDANKFNRQSNFSDLTYNLKSTKELIQRKQRLLHMTKNNLMPQMTEAQTNNAQPLPVRQDQITSTLQLLQKQSEKIKQNLSHNAFNHSLKSYNKVLQQAQDLAKQLHLISKRQSQFVQYKRQLQNRLQFLQQEITSTEMNFTQDLAQKQYCEQFLHQYQHGHQNQFKQQAQTVMKKIELQAINKNITLQKTLLQNNLQVLQKQYQQWKIQQNVQLKQKRFQNKFKQSRIQLMKIQQDLDQITQQIVYKHCGQNHFDSPIRKVRQFICAYFKKYNQININHISHAEIEDGIDIFLCKQGLIKDFTKFIVQKTQKISLIHGIYSLKLTQYCDCLKRIQKLFSTQKTEINRILTSKFEEKIIGMKQNIQNLNIQKEKNMSQVLNLQQNIEILLTQQSLSMIQFLNKKQPTQFQFNKNEGFFNLHEIKFKVKEMKLQQLKRVKRVQEVFERLKKLQDNQLSYVEFTKKNMDIFMHEESSLRKQIQIWNKKVLQIKQIKKGFESKKSKCDQLIDQAVCKMKEKDEAQKTLKALQKEIQTLKKEKIRAITQKHQNRKMFDDFRTLEQIKSKSQCSTIKMFNGRKVNLSKHPGFQRTQNKLKLQHFYIEQNDNECRPNDNASAQFRLTNKLQAASNDPIQNQNKFSNKTQSSPKQKISIETLNSILLSKCNLVESKNVIPQSKHLKKSASTFAFGREINQNELISNQLQFESNPQSLQNSKRLNKQNISRRTSISKKTQRNTQKHSNNRKTPGKLSLKMDNKESTKKPNLSNQNIFSKSKRQDLKNTTKIKDIDSIISGKLLRR